MANRPVPILAPTAAVRQGVLATLVLALPAALLQEFVVRSNGGKSPTSFLLTGVILFAAAAGGFSVMRLSPDALLMHASAAGFFGYVIVQGIGVVHRLFSGQHISWLAFPFLAMLMATCGMLGGAFERRWERGSRKGAVGDFEED